MSDVRLLSGRAAAVVARVLTGACGAAMAVFGFWALLGPASFATVIGFPPFNEHLLHDLGAFQLGIAASLLAATVLTDAMTVALLGFLVADGIHTANHVADLHLGGHGWDALVLGGLFILALIALLLRLSFTQTSPHRKQKRKDTP